mgnify:CR=1 FL=1
MPGHGGVLDRFDSAIFVALAYSLIINLIILMFFGRVGGLTLVFAALSNKPRNISKFPKEKITVG